MPSTPKIGTVGWIDLTVADAPNVRDFYASVAGWNPMPLSMGDYSDFVMCTPDGDGIAGVCHARGANAGIPPVWLIYIVVADLDQAVARVAGAGGAVVSPPRSAGGGRFALIRDPAGAHAALFQHDTPPAP